MINSNVSDPNDFKVVDFTNRTDFTFTPEMGCMFDGRPIFGITGAPGINGGESMKLPYHVGQRLAINLAKVAMTRQAPAVDPAGIPTGVPLWDTVKLESLKNSYLTDLYTEQKPIAQTEVEKLMTRVEELNKVVEGLAGKSDSAPVVESVATNPAQVPVDLTQVPKVYQDKQEVILELEKRAIKHDKRKGKVELEKLLLNA